MTDALPDNAQFGTPEDEHLYRLAMRLRETNPIRQLANMRLCKLPLPEGATSQLVKSIATPSGSRCKEQELAVTLLSHLTLEGEERTQVWYYLRNILATKQWSDYLLHYLKWVGALGVVSLPLMYLWQGAPADAMGILGYLLAAWLLWSLPGLPLCSAWEDKRLNRLRAAALRTCGRLQMIETTDMVAAALFEGAGGKQTLGYRQVREAAAEALPSLLAALKPEHYGCLPAETIPGLCRALYYADDSLVMRLLEALEVVGDGRAVTDVARLKTKGRTPEIRAAAERVLPILQERQRNENAPRMLLRAASAPAETPEVLLRPALNATATEPQELLRASEFRE